LLRLDLLGDADPHARGTISGQPRARRATYSRSSDPNHGGSPATAFSRARSGRRVAGIARSTLGSESTHFRSACAHVSIPNGRSGARPAAEDARLTSGAPVPPKGRITT